MAVYWLSGMYVASGVSGHLVGRYEVDENGVQQLLSDSIPLHYDGTHQIQHMHLYLLIMAVTVTHTQTHTHTHTHSSDLIIYI